MPQHNFTPPAGELRTELLDSPLLDNLLGDPTLREIAIYLPRGYHESDRAYPLLVSLAPFSGSGLKQLSWRGFGETLPQQLDRLTAAGRIGPCILVMPDAFTTLGGNQYVDSPVLGQWSRYLREALVPMLESRYRVLTAPAHRGVFGKSSGGYGALLQAMDHGAFWGAAASHAGDIGFDWVYGRELASVAISLSRDGGSIARFGERIRAARALGGSDFMTLMMIAMAASYDPEPTEPMGAVLPIDLHTGVIDETRFARWRSFDPLYRVHAQGALDSLQKLRALWIDVGTQDETLSQFGARRLSASLRELGVAHHFEEFEGGHREIDHRFDHSLPYLWRAIAPASDL